MQKKLMKFLYFIGFTISLVVITYLIGCVFTATVVSEKLIVSAIIIGTWSLFKAYSIHVNLTPDHLPYIEIEIPKKLVAIFLKK